MDFELSQQEKMLLTSVEEFASKEFPLELVRELDEREEFPREIFTKMAKIGWLSLPIRPEYGGTGGTTIENILLIENLAKYFAAAAGGYLIHLMNSHLIELHGNEEQKGLFLPKLSKGEIFIAFALTEPSGGTDALAMSSYAERKGDHYVLNGQKTWISFADIADYILTVMRTDLNPPKKSMGITLFLVPRQSPGIEITPLRKLGYRAFHSCDVFYDNVEVPLHNVVGKIDEGFYNLLTSLNVERLGAGALALGVGQATFEASLQYAKQRNAFERPIGQFQHIQRYISDMAVNLEQARLLLYKAAWLDSEGKPAALECNMAKFACTEASAQTTSDAMRIFASVGYSSESDIQRYFRDSRVGLFAPVSNEMIRNIICQHLGLPRSY